ncbi:MAG TPA: HD domain-containing phosphohydrolase [Intrasporangium sp.]|nr:HD domain-containing phosphohydrolase [Intrasporangium sp.]
MAATRAETASPSRGLLAYVLTVSLVAVLLGVVVLIVAGPPPWTATALFVILGLVSFNLRVPDVGSRLTLSFLMVVLLASGVVLGPFGAWLVGAIGVLGGVGRGRWYQGVYNMAMGAMVGTLGALTYRFLGGAIDVEHLSGVAEIGLKVGLPLLIADIVLCVGNALLLAGVVRIDQGHPFIHMVRQMLATTGPSYIGYGVISFLFVVLWYPAQLGPVSALFILAPLLVARWGFIQYVDEMRSHQRTVDTLVTALGTKYPAAVERSRHAALLAEWISEDLGLSPHQVATAQHVATLHGLGDLGVRPGARGDGHGAWPDDADAGCRAARARLGARMIEGIEFLDPAAPGIEHQHDAYDGREGTLAGNEIPVSARIVAVATSFEALARELGDKDEAMRQVRAEAGGQFDPEVVAALHAALQRHPWPPAVKAQEQETPA